MVNLPTPPENRLQCSACGYTEVKSKYKHTCYHGIVVCVLLSIIGLAPVIMLLIKIWEII